MRVWPTAVWENRQGRLQGGDVAETQRVMCLAFSCECSVKLRVSFHESPYRFSVDLRNDAVARKTPSVNASGHPISQQAKAGFGAPRFSVVADDPLGAVPEICICMVRGDPPCAYFFGLLPLSVAETDVHSACGSCAIWRGSWSMRFLSPASVAIPALSFQSRADGVTNCDSSPFSSISPFRLPERVFLPPCTSATVGVGQCAFAM
jgi:hypothetical protein